MITMVGRDSIGGAAHSPVIVNVTRTFADACVAHSRKKGANIKQQSNHQHDVLSLIGIDTRSSCDATHRTSGGLLSGGVRRLCMSNSNTKKADSIDHVVDVDHFSRTIASAHR